MPDEKAAEILVKIAALEERVANFGEQLHDLTESHRRLVAQANRWKGALALLLALGALAGWLVNQTGGRLIGGS